MIAGNYYWTSLADESDATSQSTSGHGSAARDMFGEPQWVAVDDVRERSWHDAGDAKDLDPEE